MTLNNLAEQLPWLLRTPQATHPTPPAAIFSSVSAGKSGLSAVHGPSARFASFRGDALSSGSSSTTAAATPTPPRAAAAVSSISFSAASTLVPTLRSTADTTMGTGGPAGVQGAIRKETPIYPSLPPPPRPRKETPIYPPLPPPFRSTPLHGIGPAPTSASTLPIKANPPLLPPHTASTTTAHTPARSKNGLEGPAGTAAVPSKIPSKTPSKTPRKTSSTPAPSSLRRAKSPAHGSPYLPDFGSDINLDDFDSVVDLTTDGTDGTDGSSAFLSSASKRLSPMDVRQWGEDPASRPGHPQLPPPKQTTRGKKRKSGDISGSPSAKASEKRKAKTPAGRVEKHPQDDHDKENTFPDAEDEFDNEFNDSGAAFPDVNELLGFGLSSPITNRRPVARSPKKSTLTNSPKKAPLHPPEARLPAPPEAPATPPKRRKRFSGSNDDVVMDSEDEFDTPSTRHTASFVTCLNESYLADMGGVPSPRDLPSHQPKAPALPSASGIEAAKSEEKHSTVNDDSAMEVEPEADEGDIRHVDGKIAEAKAPESAENGTDALQELEPRALDTSTSDDAEEEATQRPSILAFWPALRWRQHGLEKRIQENTADYMRALREKWTPARRLQIKGEKEPLLKEKQSLDDLVEAVKAYARLFDSQETLFHAITMAYQSHQDTEADEIRLDELSCELQERETVLRTQLAHAAIDPSSRLDDDFDPGSPHSTVVPATQVAEGYVHPILSHNNAGSSDSPSQVVLQTQLPQPAPLSRTAPLREKADNASDGFQDDNFDDDFFNEMEALPSILGAAQGAGLGRAAHSNGYLSRRSPARPQAAKTQDFFSDFSDDVEMLQVAEDFEQQHSSGSRAAALRPSSTSTRPALMPTSGNAGAPAQQVRSATTKKSVGPPGPSTSHIAKASFPPEQMRFPWSQDVRRALKDRFRMSGFRHNQLEAINATLSGKDAFVLMPTGGGKSLCYMLPAVISSGRTRGVTIVISPLLSLMQDQVDHLNALNIAASSFSSGTPLAARHHLLALFTKPHPEHFLQLLYVSPEMVSMSQQFCNGLATLYRNGNLARLVIDEAHCVSQWGHDFRPDYTAIGKVRQQFPNVPVMALTATATSNVIADIQHNLNMKDCTVFSQSFNRPNLYYEVRKKGKGCVDSIAELISSKYAGQTGIVYTLSQKSTVSIAEKLQACNISAHHYHAGIPAEQKTQIQRDWQSGRIKIVVATIAFGMGIDKPDVRFVIHQYLPKSLEGYYQETGRAGRDGKHSDCYLYFGLVDVRNLTKFITDSEASFEQKERQRGMLNRMIEFAQNTHDCRRVQILRYFGERFDPAGCGGTCDNCRSGGMLDVADLTDVTEYGVAVLRVVEAYRTITALDCAGILLGSTVPAHRSLNAFHGMAGQLKRHDVNAVIYKLLNETALVEENIINGAGIAITHYRMGPRAREYLAGKTKLKVAIKVGDKTAKAKKTKVAVSKGIKADAAEKAPAARKSSKTPSKAASKGKEVGRPSAARSSTLSSSKKKRSGVSVAILDVDVNDDDGDAVGGSNDSEPEAYDGPLHANGYAKDEFVVSDNDDGNDGSSDIDDDFEHRPRRRQPVPPKRTPARPAQQLQLQHYAFGGLALDEPSPSGGGDSGRRRQQHQRQRRLEELGGPIARDARLAEANVNPIHADTITAFVDEARRLEEKLRNEKGLRILFTESHLREMAIGWTDTVDKMLQIRAIDADHVRRHGAKFVPLVRRFHAMYREMMGEGSDGASASGTLSKSSAARSPPVGLVAEFVDLISSDEEDGGGGEAVDNDVDDNDDYGETSSKYFASGTADGPEAAAATQWRAELETLQSQRSGRGSRSTSSGGGNGGGRSYKRGGRSGGGRGRRPPYVRGGGGGGSAPCRSRPSATASGGGSGVAKAPPRKTGSSTFGGSSSSRGGGGASRIGMMPL